MAQQLILEEERDKKVAESLQRIYAEAAATKEAARREDDANARRVAKQRNDDKMLIESKARAAQQDAADAHLRHLAAQRMQMVDDALEQRRNELEQMQMQMQMQMQATAVSSELRPRRAIALTPQQVAALRTARQLASMNFRRRPGTSTSATSATSAAILSRGDEDECVVCMDRPRTIVLYPCEHGVLCDACCCDIRSSTNECPMCRAHILGATSHGSTNPATSTREAFL